jgi:hypothetical protein
MLRTVHPMILAMVWALYGAGVLVCMLAAAHR